MESNINNASLFPEVRRSNFLRLFFLLTITNILCAFLIPNVQADKKRLLSSVDYAKSLTSFSLKYYIKHKRPFRDFISFDDYEIDASYFPKADSFIFLLKKRLSNIMYDGKYLYEVDSAKKNITKKLLDFNSVFHRTSVHFFAPILNRGENIQRYLDDSTSLFSSRDTIVNNMETHAIRIENQMPFKPDSSLTQFEGSYFLAKTNDLIVGFRTVIYFLGEITMKESFLESHTLNNWTLEDLKAEIGRNLERYQKESYTMVFRP